MINASSGFILLKSKKKLAKKYQNKEMDFLKLLYEGISDDEIRSVFKIISKMEKNLMKAELVS